MDDALRDNRPIPQAEELGGCEQFHSLIDMHYPREATFITIGTDGLPASQHQIAA